MLQNKKNYVQRNGFGLHTVRQWHISQTAFPVSFFNFGFASPFLYKAESQLSKAKQCGTRAQSRAQHNHPPPVPALLPVLVDSCNYNAYRSHWGSLKDRPRSQGLVIAHKCMQGWKFQELAALRECGLTMVPFCSCFQEQWALCNAALIMEQKNLSNHTEMLENFSNSTSFTDYNQLGFNLRSNIFQGEGTQILMPDLWSWFQLHFAWAQGSRSALSINLTVGNHHFPLLFFLTTITAFPGTWGNLETPFLCILSLSFLSLFFFNPRCEKWRYIMTLSFMFRAVQMDAICNSNSMSPVLSSPKLPPVSILTLFLFKTFRDVGLWNFFPKPLFPRSPIKTNAGN